MVLDFAFLDKYFETMNVLTLSHIASHTTVDDNLDNDFNSSD